MMEQTAVANKKALQCWKTNVQIDPEDETQLMTIEMLVLCPSSKAFGSFGLWKKKVRAEYEEFLKSAKKNLLNMLSYGDVESDEEDTPRRPMGRR